MRGCGGPGSLDHNDSLRLAAAMVRIVSSVLMIQQAPALRHGRGHHHGAVLGLSLHSGSTCKHDNSACASPHFAINKLDWQC
jgi:hypothetical protein